MCEKLCSSFLHRWFSLEDIKIQIYSQIHFCHMCKTTYITASIDVKEQVREFLILVGLSIGLWAQKQTLSLSNPYLAIWSCKYFCTNNI